jgi:hypothetical protein
MPPYTAPSPTLAQRAWELRTLSLDGAQVVFFSGRALCYRFRLSPSEFGRIYTCELRLTPDGRPPEMFVLDPDLKTLANEEDLPHIYPSKGAGTKLCLWWPKQREWLPQMKLAETYIPWTSEWLWYFEDWLATGIWSGGGEHPPVRVKRWA